ncbi:hypothetical protein DSECCO2_487050 [anaerobic digester metagenome]
MLTTFPETVTSAEPVCAVRLGSLVIVVKLGIMVYVPLAITLVKMVIVAESVTAKSPIFQVIILFEAL